MTNYGIIDLGSNSIRLVIFQVEGNRLYRRGKRTFSSIINDKVIVGLSAYVEDELFTEAGVRKAAEVLAGHLSRAEYFRCKRVDIFATAVLRNCRNSSQVVAAIEDAIRHRINLLSNSEEAHLGFVGATCDRSIEHGTLVDIGGGSTELTSIRDTKDRAGLSLGQGSVSSYAQWVNLVIPTAHEVKVIQESFGRLVEGIASLDQFKDPALYGIGGSVRAAAKLYGEISASESKVTRITRKEVGELLRLMVGDPSKFAHAAVKAVPERLHTVGPGCAIIQTLMNELQAERLEICRHGIREGYLLERILS